MIQSEVRFAKATATGNDFILIDGRQAELELNLAELLGVSDRTLIARKLCDRHFGVGADGLVFLEAEAGQVRWDFYNNDGSPAEMCGNAARCFALYARALGLAENEFHFTTQAGSIETRFLGSNEVEVTMTPPQVVAKAEKFSVTLSGDLINSGVPHIVLEVASTQNLAELKETARSLRFHPSAGEDGANITFRSALSPTRIQSLSFERGIEDFTLSCGTGAVAAALSHKLHGGKGDTIEVQVPGGVVEVGFNRELTRAVLRGPGQILFFGTINESWV